MERGFHGSGGVSVLTSYVEFKRKFSVFGFEYSGDCRSGGERGLEKEAASRCGPVEHFPAGVNGGEFFELEVFVEF